MPFIDIHLVLAQPFFALSLGLFTLGWFISFIGVCVLGGEWHMGWVAIFYNLFLLLGATLAVATEAVHNYRLVLLTFLGGSLFLTFATIDSTVYVGFAKTSAVAAGFIFQSFVLIFWVFFFGAEEDSLVKRSMNGFVITRNPGASAGASTQGMVNGHNANGGVDGTIRQENLSSVVVSPSADYAYKARALYTYQANPEDPNELAFAKGDILDIVDNKGKWWQARKQDGTIGIAPSNYLQLI